MIHILNEEFTCGIGHNHECSFFRPRFETPEGKYGWLTRGTFIATLELDRSGTGNNGNSGRQPALGAIRIKGISDHVTGCRPQGFVLNKRDAICVQLMICDMQSRQPVINGLYELLRTSFGCTQSLQLKFAASFLSPSPLYCACLG